MKNALLLTLMLLCLITAQSQVNKTAHQEPANMVEKSGLQNENAPLNDVAITIGEGNQYPVVIRMPYDFNWRNTLSQTLYYPEEIPIARGIIDKLSYEYTFEDDILDKEIKIWIGETDLNNLNSGWVDPSTLTMVFNGNVDFPSGVQSVTITFDAPYEYNGGTLVIYSNRAFEQNYYGFENRFYSSLDNNRNRTRQLSEDFELDPMNPGLGYNYVMEWHPNTTLHFPESELGTIEGFVTDGTNPLDSVQVEIPGTTEVVYTNVEGHYTIPYILADTYDVSFTKAGYQTYVKEDLVVESEIITTLNAELPESALYSVSGTVIDAVDEPVENAEISLTGVSTYSTTSDENGDFIIEDVFENPYSLSISADGYEVYEDNIILNGGNLELGTLMLDDMILTPIGLQAVSDTTQPGNTTLKWFHGPQREFRWDNGTYTYWIGADSDPSTVFGTVYRNKAVLTNMSWYLSSEISANDSVTVWVYGLDAEGSPDIDKLLFSQSGVPSTNDVWSSFEFPQAIEAPNGFLAGVSCYGILGLGMDDGTSEEWPFQYNTHYFSLNINSEDFAPIESIGGYLYNFMVRAHGIDNGELPLESPITELTPKTPTQELIVSPAQNSITPPHPRESKVHTQNNLRSLNGFNVFVDNLEEPIAQSDTTEYYLSGLSAGQHTAGIQAIYSSGVSDIATIDFIIDSSSTQLQQLALNNGYQLVSSNLLPTDPNMQVICASLIENESLSFIRSSDGSMLRKIGTNWVNNIGDWNTLEAYLIKMLDNDELVITGTGVDPQLPIDLIEGYNLLAYLPANSMDALLAMNNVLDNLDFLRSSDGKTLQKIGPNWVNNIGNMQPGEGYLAKMDADDELMYPAPSSLTTKSSKTQAENSHFSFKGGNPVDPVHSIYIKPGKGIEPGDEIAAFSADKMVGSIVILNSNLLKNEMPVFSTLTDGEGYKPGEPIVLKMWDRSDNKEYSLDSEMLNPYGDAHTTLTAPEGDGKYSIVRVQKSGLLDNATAQVFELYPNPAKDHITLETGVCEQFDFYIMDMTGKMVLSGKLRDSKTDIDLSTIGSGVYILAISNDQITHYKKLVRN